MVLFPDLVIGFGHSKNPQVAVFDLIDNYIRIIRVWITNATDLYIPNIEFDLPLFLHRFATRDRPLAATHRPGLVDDVKDLLLRQLALALIGPDPAVPAPVVAPVGEVDAPFQRDPGKIREGPRGGIGVAHSPDSTLGIGS